MRRSDNDEFESISGKVSTKTNFSGGIQGGLSNGEEIYFKVAFKPVATILTKQNSIALVIVDHLLRNRTTKL